MRRTTFTIGCGHLALFLALMVSGTAFAADRELPPMTLGEPEVSMEAMPTAGVAATKPVARTNERRAQHASGNASQPQTGKPDQQVDPVQWQKVQGLAQALLRAKLEEGQAPDSARMDAQVAAARTAREEIDRERLRVTAAGSSISRGPSDPGARQIAAQLERTTEASSALGKARSRLAKVDGDPAGRSAGRVPTHVAYKAWEVHNEQARGEVAERSAAAADASDAPRPFIEINPSPTILTLGKPAPLPKRSR
jgi:hypothetical protein